MLKIITCPQCGQRLCKAEIGSKVEITCFKCKVDYEGVVDERGGVHALPLKVQTLKKAQ